MSAFASGMASIFSAIGIAVIERLMMEAPGRRRIAPRQDARARKHDEIVRGLEDERDTSVEDTVIRCHSPRAMTSRMISDVPP